MISNSDPYRNDELTIVGSAGSNKRIAAVENLEKKDNHTPYVLILLFLILAAGMITAGYLYYRNYTSQHRVEVERQLSAIADLKVGELVQWRKERFGDAAVFFGNEAFSSLVRRYFNHPNDMMTQRQIWTWLSKIQFGYSYERILLFDARGALRMSIPDSKEPVASGLTHRAVIVMRSEQIGFQDFYRDEPDPRIYLTVMVPILSKEDGGKALGTLVLRIDPETYLYPLISRWPTPSRTAETLLVRREGNEVVFLNDLRFQPDAALKLRVPLEKVELPAVRATLGQEGIVEGKDYRGVPVIAAIRAIPYSPWFVVARMDLSEVYGPLKERLWLVIILMVALLIGVGAGISLVWRQQHMRFYRERHAAAAALRESEGRLLSITEGSPVPAFVIGKDHRILYWNRALERLSRIPAGEVIGTTHQWRVFYAQERPCMADLLVDGAIDEIPKWYEGKYIKSGLIDGAYEATDFFPNLGEKGRWLHFTAAVVLDSRGHIIGAMETLEDITDRKQAEQARQESEALYKGLAEKSIAGVYVVQDGKFRFINANAASYAGYTREELLNRDASILVSPEDKEKVKQNAMAMLRGKMSSPYEFRIITKQGETRWIMETVTSILHEGRPAILGNSMDITERKRSDDALQENQRRLTDIVTFLPDATLAIDKDKRIIIWNKAIEEMTGIPAAEMIGKGDYAYTVPFYGEARPQLMDLVFLDHKEIASRYPTITREGDSLEAEVFCNALYNNKGAWIFAKASPLHDQYGNLIGAIEIVRDITAQKHAEEQIRQMAHHDSLTGLPNRKLFSDRLGIALAQARRNQKGVAVTMLDLDHFKDVNDTLGHDVGDLLLKAAAERLSAALRKGDTVARFGGDEFVLILPDLKGMEDVIRVAQKIVESFRQPFLIDAHQFIVTTSIGIAVHPHDGTDEATLLKNADIAMYQVKQTGRDRYQLFKEA
jgi:diguanylate cyclase (GGDEF)-like protein/PAS domain S-box-containing protein